MSQREYRHYGIPTTYVGITYNDLNITAPRLKRLTASIKQAPISGLLIVKGNAAPIINQLFESRTIRGIDFMKRAGNAFEQHTNPEAEVIIIYSVGSEITLNYK